MNGGLGAAGGAPAELCQGTAEHLPWCGMCYLSSPCQKKKKHLQSEGGKKKVFPNKNSHGVWQGCLQSLQPNSFLCFHHPAVPLAAVTAGAGGQVLPADCQLCHEGPWRTSVVRAERAQTLQLVWSNLRQLLRPEGRGGLRTGLVVSQTSFIHLYNTIPKQKLQN